MPFGRAAEWLRYRARAAPPSDEVLSEMLTTLKVPFGLLAGVLVEPGVVANGKACGCLCPGCARPLVAYNQGKVRTTHYFGHRPGEECGRGIESAIHMAGKDALVREKRMTRPPLVVGDRGILPRDARPPACVTVESSSLAAYATVTDETSHCVDLPAAPQAPQPDLFMSPNEPTPPMQLLRPDLRAVDGEFVDWVEIRVTHAVDSVKQSAMQRAGMRVVEVDLSDFLRKAVDLAEVTRAVVEDVARKTWLAHPGVPAAIAVAQVEAKRLAEEQRRRDAFRRIEADIAGQAPRKWLGDGVPPDEPIVVTRPEQPRDAEYRSIEAEQRRQLGLRPSDKLPKHLHLDIQGNEGCLAPARLWVAQLFIDWVHGRRHGRFLLNDLERAVSRKFGIQARNGARDIQRVLVHRVLPYWEACGFVELLEDEAIQLTGKAHGGVRLPKN